MTEAFDGTVTIGTDAPPERILAAADFIKKVGKKSTAKSIMFEAGKALQAFHGRRNHRQDRGPCDRILAQAKFAPR